jgi:hypothetical protein
MGIEFVFQLLVSPGNAQFSPANGPGEQIDELATKNQ